MGERGSKEVREERVVGRMQSPEDFGTGRQQEEVRWGNEEKHPPKSFTQEAHLCHSEEYL